MYTIVSFEAAMEALKAGKKVATRWNETAMWVNIPLAGTAAYICATSQFAIVTADPPKLKKETNVVEVTTSKTCLLLFNANKIGIPADISWCIELAPATVSPDGWRFAAYRFDLGGGMVFDDSLPVHRVADHLFPVCGVVFERWVEEK